MQREPEKDTEWLISLIRLGAAWRPRALLALTLILWPLTAGLAIWQVDDPQVASVLTGLAVTVTLARSVHSLTVQYGNRMWRRGFRQGVEAVAAPRKESGVYMFPAGRHVV
ncbi:MAG TPA: hypothetical protein VFQ44_01660 [Streptosporangiaceae bacterium]|nr:hypothetical protein [Streptosporangiaceae bacterium]